MSKSNIKNLYSKFQTDPQKEITGVDLDLGVCIITCARAGGDNLEFQADMERTFAPYNQVMDLGEMPEPMARALSYGVYARQIIKRWRYRDAETLELHEGMGVDDDGNTIALNEASVVELFKSAHDMYLQVRNFAQSKDGYLLTARASASKNS